MPFYLVLLCNRAQYQVIRRNAFRFNKPVISNVQLEQLRIHISNVYGCNATTTFAYNIYMKA